MGETVFLFTTDARLFCIAVDLMLQRDTRDEMVKAFKLFDDDDSGKISLKKLRRIAR